MFDWLLNTPSASKWEGAINVRCRQTGSVWNFQPQVGTEGSARG